MTYSLSVTGYDARNPITTIETLKVPDTDASGNASATTGGLQHLAQTGNQVLCKGPDGGLHWYVLDPYRSTPANPVLLFVGP